jgi:hypothetical protein
VPTTLPTKFTISSDIRGLAGSLKTTLKTPEISMSGNITYLDTLTLGEGNPGLVLSNDEDVGLFLALHC